MAAKKKSDVAETQNVAASDGSVGGVVDLASQVAALTEDVKKLERRLSMLESRPVAASAAPGIPANDTSTFSYDKLSLEWADKVVRRNPPRWDGADMAGKQYSELTPAELDVLAEFLQWQASMDSRKPDPKKASNGKYFYESTAFDAKLARTWSAYKKDNPNAGATESGDIPWE